MLQTDSCYHKIIQVSLPHPSYNDLHILEGQGVAALEVLEQMNKLGVEPDAIIIPVGGGGLLAGMVTVIKHLKPHMEIIVCVHGSYHTMLQV